MSEQSSFSRRVSLVSVDELPSPPPANEEKEAEIDWENMDANTKLKMLEYKDLFDYFDEDGSGAIDEYEVPSIWHPLHIYLYKGHRFPCVSLLSLVLLVVLAGPRDAAAGSGPVRRRDPHVHDPGTLSPHPLTPPPPTLTPLTLPRRTRTARERSTSPNSSL